MSREFIKIGGAREHNLKNLTLQIPRDILSEQARCSFETALPWRCWIVDECAIKCLQKIRFVQCARDLLGERSGDQVRKQDFHLIVRFDESSTAVKWVKWVSTVAAMFSGFRAGVRAPSREALGA